MLCDHSCSHSNRLIKDSARILVTDLAKVTWVLYVFRLLVIGTPVKIVVIWCTHAQTDNSHQQLHKIKITRIQIQILMIQNIHCDLPFCELTNFILLLSKFLSVSCCMSSSPFTISNTVPSRRQVAIPDSTS